MVFWTSGRPNPVPSARVVKKGVKIRGRASGECPAVVGDVDSERVPFLHRAGDGDLDSPAVPGLGAFRIKLWNACLEKGLIGQERRKLPRNDDPER